MFVCRSFTALVVVVVALQYATPGLKLSLLPSKKKRSITSPALSAAKRARKPLSMAIRSDMITARGHPTTTAHIRASAREMQTTQKQRIAPAAKQPAQSRRPVNSVARSMVSRLVILISQSGLQTSRDIGMSAPAAIISRIWEYTGLENGRLYADRPRQKREKGYAAVRSAIMRKQKSFL